MGGYRFLADERALIPRSPITHLILDELSPWWGAGSPPDTIVEVCCGGGYLGIVPAQIFHQSFVCLADLDQSALALELDNVALHRLSGRVGCYRENLLSAIAPKSVDLIIANPPYVSALEMEDLPPEYWHESVMALVAEEDGTRLAGQLLQQAAAALRSDGLMLLEVGETM